MESIFTENSENRKPLNPIMRCSIWNLQSLQLLIQLLNQNSNWLNCVTRPISSNKNNEENCWIWYELRKFKNIFIILSIIKRIYAYLNPICGVWNLRDSFILPKNTTDANRIKENHQKCRNADQESQRWFLILSINL